MEVWIELYYDELGNLVSITPYKNNKEKLIQNLEHFAVEIFKNTDDEIIYEVPDGSMGKIVRREVL